MSEPLRGERDSAAAESASLAALSRMIRHQVGIQRVSAGASNRAAEIIARSDAEVERLITRYLSRIEGRPVSSRRVESVIRDMMTDIRRVRMAAYREAASSLATEAKDLARFEAKFTADIYGLDPKTALSRVPGIVESRPVQGIKTRLHVKRLVDTEMTAIQRRIASLRAEGRAASTIARAIRGGRGIRGVLNGQSRRNAASWSRSVVGHATGWVRDELFASNAGKVKEVVWNSILDGSTTPQCLIRANKRYTNPDHEPIGHSVPWSEGPGRLHYRCRSTPIPVLNGQEVPDLPSWGEWIQAQPRKVQVFALGERRTRLLRDGRLDTSRFFDRSGEWLKLDDLLKEA